VVLGSALLAGAVVGAGLSAPPAQAYWTDTGTITSGPFTTWALTDVACPDPQWGNNTVASWQVPSGSSSTVSVELDPASPAVTGNSYWATSLAPGAPVTTTNTNASWGVGTYSLYETAHFYGTWQVVATSPGGLWTATSAGTWTVYYTNSTSGTATCTVDP